jgi:hypothetical protein
LISVFRVFWLPEIIILVALGAVLTYLLIKGQITWLKAVVLLIVGDIVYLIVANISVAAIVFGILRGQDFQRVAMALF